MFHFLYGFQGEHGVKVLLELRLSIFTVINPCVFQLPTYFDICLFQRHILKYDKVLKNTRRPEVLIKELKVRQLVLFSVVIIAIPCNGRAIVLYAREHFSNLYVGNHTI